MDGCEELTAMHSYKIFNATFDIILNKVIFALMFAVLLAVLSISAISQSPALPALSVARCTGDEVLMRSAS